MRPTGGPPDLETWRVRRTGESCLLCVGGCSPQPMFKGCPSGRRGHAGEALGGGVAEVVSRCPRRSPEDLLTAWETRLWWELS